MVLTSKWGRIAMPMTNLINVCAQCRQTGQNADKIPCHTSEVNYVCMVLHCALSSTREGEVFSQRGSGFRQLCLLIPTKRNPWHEFITCSFVDID